MKKSITLELDIDDKYLESWNSNFFDYCKEIYKDEDKAKKALIENPFEKALADDIAEYVESYYKGVMSCNIKI